MKAAVIVPQGYLHMIKDKDYHMSLAHLINVEGFEDYTRFYREIGDDGNKYLILDNGVIETGFPMAIEDIIHKALNIRAQEIILPDAFRDSFNTLKLAQDAIRYLKAIGFEDDFKLMGVPQGESISQWLECARAMLKMDIDTIGIPKVLVDFGGRDARAFVLKELKDEINKAGVQVHLLGCWKEAIELKILAKLVKQGDIPEIRGVDTALAYVYSKAGMLLTHDERPAASFEFNEYEVKEDLLQNNITLYEQACMIPEDTSISQIH